MLAFLKLQKKAAVLGIKPIKSTQNSRDSTNITLAKGSAIVFRCSFIAAG